jgi:hypothetical protein
MLVRCKLKRLAAALPYWERIAQLFDASFYLRKYPDVACARIHPLRHYLEHGASEGRKPHALFDHDYYLLYCPEARNGNEPSIFHFLKRPGPAGNPHPLFDCAAYLRTHPDVCRQGMNPLVHFARGQRAARRLAEPGTAAKPALSCLEILDFQVRIAFTGDDCELPEGIVRVWEDSLGRIRFVAPAQQEPFFAAMKYDQLRAQANGRL